MKSLNLKARELLHISVQCIGVLLMFCAFISVPIIMNGCSTVKQKEPEVVFKTVNRPIPVLPSIPEYLLIDYQGAYPISTPEGEVCFAGDEIRNLQELLQFLTNQNKSLKELLR